MCQFQGGWERANASLWILLDFETEEAGTFSAESGGRRLGKPTIVVGEVRVLQTASWLGTGKFQMWTNCWHLDGSVSIGLRTKREIFF